MRSRPVALVASLAVVLAACGGGAASGGVASLSSDTTVQPQSQASDTAPSEEDALLAFAQCMRDNGVDMADPTDGGSGRIFIGPPPGSRDDATGSPRLDETTRAAMEACGDLLDGIRRSFDDLDQTALQDRMLEYTACMRDNGVDMPDPDFSEAGGGPGGGLFRSGQVNPDDPAFQAAQKACSDILGFPGGGQGGFPDGGPGGGGEGGTGGVQGSSDDNA
jgi:hypothetical protein